MSVWDAWVSKALYGHGNARELYLPAENLFYIHSQLWFVLNHIHVLEWCCQSQIED